VGNSHKTHPYSSNPTQLKEERKDEASDGSKEGIRSRKEGEMVSLDRTGNKIQESTCMIRRKKLGGSACNAKGKGFRKKKEDSRQFHIRRVSLKKFGCGLEFKTTKSEENFSRGGVEKVGLPWGFPEERKKARERKKISSLKSDPTSEKLCAKQK